MNILVLDNGDAGRRLSSWQSAISDHRVEFRNSISSAPEGTLDAIIIHYSDFDNGTYQQKHIYCFLQGLFFDRQTGLSSTSNKKSWQDYIVNFTSSDIDWEPTWYDIGKSCSKALFFTGGSERQFSGDFKDIIGVLEGIETRVAYCYPVSVAQKRLKQVLSEGVASEHLLLGFDPRVEYSIELLQEFLPLDIALQIDNATTCKEQAKLLTQRRTQCEEMLEKACLRVSHVEDTNLNKSKELLKELFDLTASVQSSMDENFMAMAFGFDIDPSQSREGVRTSDLDESGFHRKFLKLRDMLLAREELGA